MRRTYESRVERPVQRRYEIGRGHGTAVVDHHELEAIPGEIL
jgi:hypothetical protein